MKNVIQGFFAVAVMLLGINAVAATKGTIEAQHLRVIGVATAVIEGDVAKTLYDSMDEVAEDTASAPGETWKIGKNISCIKSAATGRRAKVKYQCSFIGLPDGLIEPNYPSGPGGFSISN